MRDAQYDPLDGLLSTQFYDAAAGVFGGSKPGDHSTYYGALWVGEPLTGLGESTLISLQSMLAGAFPAGSVMQFMLLASPDIEETINGYRVRKDEAYHPLLNELVQRHADHVAAGVRQPLVKVSGMLIHKKRLVISLKCEFDKASPPHLAAFCDEASKFESTLRANGLGVTRTGPAEMLSLCRLITHIYDAPDVRYDENLPINEQVFYAGDEVIVRKDHLALNTGSSPDKNFSMAALSPKFLPHEFHLGLMNYLIGDPRGMANQLRNPYMMVLTLYFPDQLQKKQDIERKASWINHQLFGGSTSKSMPRLAMKKEGFDTLQHEIESNSAVLVEASFTLWVYGKQLQEVRALSEDVRTYWASLGFDMRTDKVVTDVLLSESLPLNPTRHSARGLNRTHTMSSSQAAQFMPLIGEWRGSDQPTVLLTTRRGEVGGFDLYNSSSNYNAVLVAQAGSGKSFWTQRLITDYLAEGAKVWAIDSGRSYQKLAAAVGGTFMEFSPESDICLNPFTAFLPERGGEDKKINDDLDMITSLVERMAAQRDLLTDLEMEIVRKAIRQTFTENHGHTTIQNISNWLAAQTADPRARDLALRLDSFAYGQYARYFNSHSNVNMSNNFVVLELDDLKNQKQLQQVVLLQLVAQITNEMYLTRGRKKILVIDEAWAMLDDPIMGRAMEAAFRQARKHDGAVVVVTQGIADLYSSAAAKAMIDNAAWQLILAQKAEAVDNVYNSGKLVIDAYSHQMLKTVQTIPGSHSEIMVMGNGGCGIFRLIVDRFTQAMYSTTGRERHQVLNDIENGVDVIESLQRLIVGDESFERIKQVEMLIEEAMRLGSSKEEVSRMVHNAAQNVENLLLQERA